MCTHGAYHRSAALLLVVSLALNSANIGALPDMPPVIDPNDIYSETHVGKLSPAVRDFPERIYVPNNVSGTVDVIDPLSFKVINEFKVGRQPQHVTPSYDLKTLWVLNDLGDSLTKIDPATGNKVATIPVKDPYNMYYTPDGRYAIVVAERIHRLDFRNPATMAIVDSVVVPCRGIDHMDFSADGKFLIASCEFSGSLVKLDVATRTVLGVLTLPVESSGPGTAEAAPMSRGFAPKHRRARAAMGSMPQDVKTSPDGKTFYVADMVSGGVHLVDDATFTRIGFIPTGRGAHGLYVSRDSKLLYCSNRDEGSVSVINFEQRKVVQRWTVPGGGSPDMGGVSADGRVLWLSGRYNREVYAFDTANGRLLARIPVGKGPHGLCVYPQPGRYSLGHTGVFR